MDSCRFCREQFAVTRCPETAAKTVHALNISVLEPLGRFDLRQSAPSAEDELAMLAGNITVDGHVIDERGAQVAMELSLLSV